MKEMLKLLVEAVFLTLYIAGMFYMFLAIAIMLDIPVSS